MASAITPRTFRDFLASISQEDHTIQAEKIEQFFTSHGIQPGDTNPTVVKRAEEATYLVEGWSYPETWEETLSPEAGHLEPSTEILTYIHPATSKVDHLIIWEQRLYAYSTAYGPDDYDMDPVRPVQLRPTLASPETPEYNFSDIIMPDNSHEQLGKEWGEQHFPHGLDGPAVGATLLRTWGEPPVPGTATGGWEATQLWQDEQDGSHYLISRAFPVGREPSAAMGNDIWAPVTVTPFTRDPALVW